MRASVLFSVGKIKPYSRTAPQFPPFFLQLVATPPLISRQIPQCPSKLSQNKRGRSAMASSSLYNSLVIVYVSVISSTSSRFGFL